MATIKEDYCSFELSKLLKEKGFDAFCNQFYEIDINTKEIRVCGCDKHNNSRYDNEYSMPTLSLACKWLTTVHNLFITFELDFSDGAYPMFDAVIYNLATCEKYPIINYDRYSYIKGTEAAIKYCLENLI